MRKNIISTISIIIFVLIILFGVLFVCSSIIYKNDNSNVKGEIVIWTDAEEYDYINSIAQEFMIKNINSNIVVKKVSKNYKDELIDAKSKGTVPDIIEIDSKYTSEFIDDNEEIIPIYDCSSFISEYSSEFSNRTLQDVTIDDKIMAVPYTINPLVLYLRQDLLDEYNYCSEDIKTWNDLIKVGKDIYNKSNKRIKIINCVDKEYDYLLELLVQQSFITNSDIDKAEKFVSSKVTELTNNNILNFDVDGSFLARISSINTYKEIKLLSEECNWKANNAPALSVGGNRFFVTGGKSLVIIDNDNNKTLLAKQYILALMNNKDEIKNNNISGERFFAFNSAYNTSLAENSINNFTGKSPLVVMDNITKRSQLIPEYTKYKELIKKYIN